MDPQVEVRPSWSFRSRWDLHGASGRGEIFMEPQDTCGLYTSAATIYVQIFFFSSTLQGLDFQDKTLRMGEMDNNKWMTSSIYLLLCASFSGYTDLAKLNTEGQISVILRWNPCLLLLHQRTSNLGEKLLQSGFLECLYQCISSSSICTW